MGELLNVPTSKPPTVDETCPACHGAARALFRAVDTNRRTTAEIFQYHRCRSCALVFMAQVSSDLGRYYPFDYHMRNVGIDDVRAAAERERYKIELVTARSAPGRLLEVGGSTGLFAYLADRSGFDVTVVEMDSASCRFLTQVVGVKAIESNDVASAIADHDPYDVVTLWHVLEHLPDPWGALRALAAKLSVGGVMVIATPNPGAMQFKIFRSRWTHLDAPRHTELIPRELLERKMADLGMRSRYITTTDIGSLGYDSFGWAMSLSNLTIWPPASKALHIAGRLIARALRPIERRRRRGSCYTAVFQRVAA